MSQHYEELSKKFKEWHSIWDDIEFRRSSWETTTRQIIIDSLHGTIDNVLIATTKGEEGKVNWHVYAADGGIKHSESIIFSFGARPSGFERVTSETVERIVKEGGALIFAQSYNGRVLIIITYPRIKGLVEEGTPLVLESVEPTDITEDFVIGKVSYFIDEMMKWERGDANPTKIGFEMNFKSPSFKEI